MGPKEKTRVKFSLTPVQSHFVDITYNPEQLAFVHSPIESSTLYGIPGAGKTQSIIGRIIYQFLAGNFKKTTDYKLFTFSKRACSDFILKGRKYHPKMFQKSSIHTLHSLAGKLVYLIHQKQSSSKNSVIMAALYLFDKEANWPILRGYDPLNGCKVIFVDEAQDISDIQYKLIMKISAFYNVPVIMIGDPNQNIYQFQNGSDIYLLEHPGPKYYLIRNYRSTPAIVNVINAIRPWADLTPKMISENREWGEGEKPHVVVGTVPEIIANVVRRIRELTGAGMRAEDMAIIGPVKKSKPSADYYTNIGLSLFTNTLRDEGIPYVKHYEDGSDGDGGGGAGGGDVDQEIEYKEGAVNLFTIHGSKGLEFKVVFLLNFHLNTFGISPTEEDYNRFKYLWYVGLSRAAQYLFIYIDERKYGWYDLRSVRLEDIVYETRFPKLMPKLEFKEKINPLVFSVTEILKNKKYMNDRLYHFFHEAFGERGVERRSLWDRTGSSASTLPDSYEVDSIDQYKIYGIFMENVFNFYYHFERKIVPDFVLRVEGMIKNTIEIPKKYNRGYGILKVRLPQMTKECITLGQIYQYKNILSQSEMELFSYVSALVENDYKRSIFLLPENSVISYPRERVMEKIAWIRDYMTEVPVERHDRNLFVAILEMAIFGYQLEHETAYLWKEDLEKYVTRLRPHLEFIPGFAMECYRRDAEKSPTGDHVYQFHRKEVHRNLPIVGEFDMINCEAIVDLKFSQSNMERFIDQILMYYMIYDPTLTSTISLELWNILRGEKMIIRLDPARIQRVLLMQILAKAIGQKLRNMIFIYDLETTGLLYTNGVVDIIERHVEEYGSRSVWSAGLMRPQTIPFIPFEVTRITGITKEMVVKDGDTLAEMKEEFENIFRYCEKPTFVAHNGNSFDHKILVEKGLVDPDQCKFIDSKLLLRLLIGNAAIADKPLGQIYQYYFPSPADQIGSHRAASDVEMLIRIFQKIGGNIDGLIAASSP